MLVTDKQFYMDKEEILMYDMMIARMTGKGTDDNLILISGDEGQGKTTKLAQVMYYVAFKSGRKFDLSNIFFDLDDLINYAIKTEDQMIMWDEGALGGLATEWWSKNQIKLIKLFMVCRKKRHFIGICIPKFFKLNEYLVVDRSIGMIHVYSKDNIIKGRYLYFTKKGKEGLYQEWRSTKRRSYVKYKAFGGSFSSEFDNIIDFKAYDKKKDEAILGLDNKGVSSKKEALLNKKIEEMSFALIKLMLEKGLSMTETGKITGIHKQRISELKDKYQKWLLSLEKPAFEVRQSAKLLINGVDSDILDRQDTEGGLLETKKQENDTNNSEEAIILESIN